MCQSPEGSVEQAAFWTVTVGSLSNPSPAWFMCFIFKAPLSQLWSLTVLICHLFLCLAGRIYLLHSLIAVPWHSGWAGEPALCSAKPGGRHSELNSICSVQLVVTPLLSTPTSFGLKHLRSHLRYIHLADESVIPGILCLFGQRIQVSPRSTPGIIKYGTCSLYGPLNPTGFFSLENG